MISDEGDPDEADVDDVMEKIGDPEEISDVSEPAAQPSTSGAEEKSAANNSEGKKSAAKPEAAQLQNLRFLEEDGNTTEEKSLASVKEGGDNDGISVGKLLPGMLCSEKTLDDWEIRVVDAAEGSCTVEVSGGEKTATVVLTREDGSEESSRWTIQSAENNFKGEE